MQYGYILKEKAGELKKAYSSTFIDFNNDGALYSKIIENEFTDEQKRDIVLLEGGWFENEALFQEWLNS